MTTHPLVDSISSALAVVVPEEEAEVNGQWTSSRRNVYKNQSQLGSGEGPYVEVVDRRWQGNIRCAKPLVAIGFLITEREIWWAKSAPRHQTLAVDVCLTSWAMNPDDGAMFTGNAGEAYLPGVPVPFNGDVASCVLGPPHSATVRAHAVARLEGATFAVITLPADVIKVRAKPPMASAR